MNDTRQKPLLVAVSGGVDSVVLLHILRQTHAQLVVAHVDHGIRSDSADDAVFVEKLAASYGLPFVSTTLQLDADTSEERARHLRYEWLDEVRERYEAQAVATAHHQDDVLETMLINITRGTGWRGLCSLRSTSHRYRPLLSMSKAEIIAYALENNLQWREDETNASFRYLRNRIRHQVIPRLAESQRQELISLASRQLKLREEIEQEARRVTDLFCEDGALSRYALTMIDERAAQEVLRCWLGNSLETNRFDALALFAKTALPDAKWSLNENQFVRADKQRLIVLPPRD